jgi:hypothetical protein
MLSWAELQSFTMDTHELPGRLKDLADVEELEKITQELYE